MKQRIALLARLAIARGWVSRWLERGPHALLRRELEHDPRLLGFVVWPFVHAGWPAQRRLEVLSEHLRIVDEALPWLALAENEIQEVLPLEHLVPGLRLEIDRAPWFLREGSLVLNLWLRDHRLKSLAFSLSRDDRDVVAYVGGLQGSNRSGALETYRWLTKELQGLRPRDFVVKSFQLFAGAIGVTRILCVADACRHHRHPYFGDGIRNKLYSNYDVAWQENGGERLSSGFFLLATSPAEKALERVPSRKRAMYRRRHAMTADLGRALRSRFAPLRRSRELGATGGLVQPDGAPPAASQARPPFAGESADAAGIALGSGALRERPRRQANARAER